jgi:hypothetical protein
VKERRGLRMEANDKGENISYFEFRRRIYAEINSARRSIASARNFIKEHLDTFEDDLRNTSGDDFGFINIDEALGMTITTLDSLKVLCKAHFLEMCEGDDE